MKTDFEVPPLSKSDIEGMADVVRRTFHQHKPMLDVVRLLELGFSGVGTMLTYRIVSRAEAGPRMGYVDPVNRTLNIREDVYEGMLKQIGFDRFTVCHEIGHALLHGHLHTLNRVSSSMSVPAYKSAEWQANYFAGALLMPRKMLELGSSPREVAIRFGVTDSAARVRLGIFDPARHTIRGR